MFIHHLGFPPNSGKTRHSGDVGVTELKRNSLHVGGGGAAGIPPNNIYEETLIMICICRKIEALDRIFTSIQTSTKKHLYVPNVINIYDLVGLTTVCSPPFLKAGGEELIKWF